MFDRANVFDGRRGQLVLTVSAVLMGCVGAVFPVYFLVGCSLAAVQIYDYFQPGSPERSLRNFFWSFGLAVASGALSYLCLRCVQALYEGRRWSARVAMGFGLLLFGFAALLISDVFHPDQQSNDEYFLFPLVPFLILAGLWWWVGLNLPRVRERMGRATGADELTLQETRNCTTSADSLRE